MTTDQIIILARKHVGNGASMESSARLCLSDAMALLEKGDYKYARKRAFDSLKYSIGILHPDFAKASTA